MDANIQIAREMLARSARSLRNSQKIMERLWRQHKIFDYNAGREHAELLGRQMYFEKALSGTDSQQDSFGLLPVLAITAFLAATAGSLIYFKDVKRQMARAEAQEKYLACIDNMIARGESPSRAAEICAGQQVGFNWSKILLIGAGVGIGGLLLYSFITTK